MSTGKETTNVRWTDKMAFEVSLNGHKFMIDAMPAVGGENKGPQPKPFMLVAIGGCTAMDVISILRKMRVDTMLEDFNIDVDGELTDEHPKHFHHMHVTYSFTPKEGVELPMDKIEKAVKLSEERYCGVSESYRKSMELTSEIVIVK